MTQAPLAPPAFTAADYDRTLILAVEVSDKSWVVAAQVPGPSQGKAKRTLEPTAEALMAAIELYTRRAAAADLAVERVIVVYEAGYSGFWLARWLVRHGVEPFVIQPSSVPVDRRMPRAKSDASRQVGWDRRRAVAAHAAGLAARRAAGVLDGADPGRGR